MRKTKRVLAVLLSLALVLSVFAGASVGASPAASDNQCGDDLTWAFDEASGLLTISGTGPMWGL